MTVIITIANVTEKALDSMANKDITTLGLLELDDFRAFKAWGKTSKSKWDFVFKASKMDKVVGRVSLVAKTDEAKEILFKSRVRNLTKKFFWLKNIPGSAEGIISLLDGHSHLRDHRIRDFLLANRRNPDLLHHFALEAEVGSRDRILTAIIRTSSGDNKVLGSKDVVVKRQLAVLREMNIAITKILEVKPTVVAVAEPEAASDENYALES